MDEDTFRDLLSAWAEDVKGEALRMYRDGADPNDSLALAIKVVDSRARRRTTPGRSILELPGMPARRN